MLTVRTDIGSHSILTQSNHVTKHLRIAWGPATDTGFPLANLGKRERKDLRKFTLKSYPASYYPS